MEPSIPRNGRLDSNEGEGQGRRLTIEFKQQFCDKYSLLSSNISNVDLIKFFFITKEGGPRTDFETWILSKSAPPIKNCLKRRDIAEHSNTRGVALFVKADDSGKEERLKWCLEKFNYALLHSSFSEGSDRIDTSKRFANRSAVFYDMGRYEEALIDIEIALQLGYPFLHKVWIRKAKVYLEQGKYEEALLTVKYINDSIPIGEEESKKVQTIFKTASEGLSETKLNRNNIDQQSNADLNRRRFNQRRYQENPSFQHASRHINIAYHPDLSRHVVAADDIEAGDIIFDEPPFASILLPECYADYCYHCHSYLGGYVYPCKMCAEVKYCSEACCLKSWTEYHSVECGNSSLLRNVGLFELATRIVIKAGVEQVVRAVTAYDGSGRYNLQDSILLFDTTSDDESNGTTSEMFPYLQIYSLCEHMEKMNPMDIFTYAQTAAGITYWLQKNTSFFENRTDLEVWTVGAAILRHLCQLISNAQRLYSFGRNPDGDILDDDRVVIGSGIYASTSLMNHSCDPNISTNYKYQLGEGRRLIVKATRNIRAGEEVSNSYGVTYRRHDLKMRRSSMSQQYYFTCECVNCQAEHGSGQIFVDQFESVYCSNSTCRRPLVLGSTEDADGMMSCNQCSTPLNTRQMKLFLQKAEEYQENGLDIGGKEGHQMLEQSLALIQKRLVPNHRLIAAAHDRLAKSFIQMGIPRDAVPHLQKSLEYVSARFGHTSNEYGFELRKYAEVLDLLGIRTDSLGQKTEDIMDRALQCLENYFPSTE